MAKRPVEEIPEPTLRIMEQMLKMPPKHHEDMKLGKAKGKKKAGSKPVERTKHAGRVTKRKPRKTSR